MTARTDFVDVLASYRLTRLATSDSITEPARAAVIAAAYRARDGVAADAQHATYGGTWTQMASDDLEAPKLAQLLVCRWCMGWWISVAVVWLRRRHPDVWQPVADALALAAASVLVARLEA